MIHHDNIDDTSRYFVNLYKLYQSKCPRDRPGHPFYLQPLKNPTAEFWFSATPIGHATLAKTISRICHAAGIKGYKTNHSLRAMAESRLYQSGIDKQLIMEKTGHTSLEGVRSYKRTSMEQQENMSDILSLNKKQAVQVTEEERLSVLAVTTSCFLSNQQLTIDHDLLKHMFTFNSCSNININLNIK